MPYLKYTAAALTGLVGHPVKGKVTGSIPNHINVALPLSLLFVTFLSETVFSKKMFICQHINKLGNHSPVSIFWK